MSVTVAEMKDRSMTGAESRRHETDTEQKIYIHAPFLKAAHIHRRRMSRQERYGDVKPRRRCDLWLFDSNIHYSILSPVAAH